MLSIGATICDSNGITISANTNTNKDTYIFLEALVIVFELKFHHAGGIVIV